VSLDNEPWNVCDGKQPYDSMTILPPLQDRLFKVLHFAGITGDSIFDGLFNMGYLEKVSDQNPRWKVGQN